MPDDPLVGGKLPPSLPAGYTRRLFLDIDSPMGIVERVTFDGGLVVKKGDKIVLLIPTYTITVCRNLESLGMNKSKEVIERLTKYINRGIDPRERLVPRRLMSEEKAIEIAVKDNNGEISCIERAVGFHETIEEIKRFLD